MQLRENGWSKLRRIGMVMDGRTDQKLMLQSSNRKGQESATKAATKIEKCEI